MRQKVRAPIVVPRTASPFEKLAMVVCAANEVRVIQGWVSEQRSPNTFERRCLWRCCLAVRDGTKDELTLVAALVGFKEISEADLVGYLSKRAGVIGNFSMHTWPDEDMAHHAKDLLGTYGEIALNHLERLSTEYKALGGGMPNEKKVVPQEILKEKVRKADAHKTHSAADTSSELSLLADMLHVVGLRLERLCMSGTPEERENFRELLNKSAGHSGAMLNVVNYAAGICSETANRKLKENRGYK